MKKIYPCVQIVVGRFASNAVIFIEVIVRIVIRRYLWISKIIYKKIIKNTKKALIFVEKVL